MTTVVKNPADNQEVFDHVVNALRKQGCQAKRAEHGVCQYRGPNNTKCAAGFLIPDEDYQEEFEGQSVCYHNLGFKLSLVGEYLHNQGYNVPFVRELQDIHDSNFMWENREAYWENLAKKYNLQFKPIVE